MYTFSVTEGLREETVEQYLRVGEVLLLNLTVDVANDAQLKIVPVGTFNALLWFLVSERTWRSAAMSSRTSTNSFSWLSIKSPVFRQPIKVGEAPVLACAALIATHSFRAVTSLVRSITLDMESEAWLGVVDTTER